MRMMDLAVCAGVGKWNEAARRLLGLYNTGQGLKFGAQINSS
jgi:hypothetical protein